MKHVFTIPVGRIDGATVDVTLDVPEDFESFPIALDNAYHGIKQRVNDALSPKKFARESFATDDDWIDSCMSVVRDTARRVETGAVGTRRESAVKRMAAELVAEREARAELERMVADLQAKLAA